MMRKKIILSIILIGMICMVFIGLLYTKRIKINAFFLKDYARGVDISHYQGKIDMKQLVGQGIDFVFVKATEGKEGVDKLFAANWQMTAETSLLAGAYHFFSFDSKGTAQAKHYIDIVGDLQGKLPPVVDVEYYGKKEHNPPKEESVVKELGAYLTYVETYYHVKPVIYTTLKVYRKYIKGHFDAYPLWIRNVYCPATWSVGENWSFWQYSDTEILTGYAGEEKYIDMNVYHGTKAELEQNCIK